MNVTRQFGFRHKVLVLALALVVTTQLVLVFPVLDAIQRDSDAQAVRTVGLAGRLFDEYMRNRAEQMLTTVNVLVSDYGFKQAVASGDRPTIQSALGNHAARVGATVAVLLDLDGGMIESSADAGHGFGGIAPVPANPSFEDRWHRVVNVGGVPYQTVTVPLRAPVTIAWVMLGFPIDAKLAQHLQSLTGLEISFLAHGDGPPRVLASTLAAAQRAEALAGLDSGMKDARVLGAGLAAHWTLAKPFLSEDSEVSVAIQLPLSTATASYREVSRFLWAITGASLLLAVSGSFLFARTVTRPVQNLVAAARRMREGIYTERIEVDSSDELGELAGSFNAMQLAIAERERQIVHQAHHDSLTGLPNRALSIELLREALQRTDILSVVSLGLDRFAGIVSSLGHRAGDEIIELMAGSLRSRLDKDQLLGHLSDHEFVIGLPGFDARQAVEWAERQADLLRGGVQVRNANISLQVTCGVACHPEHSRDAADLCRWASSARSGAQFRSETVALYQLGQEDRSLLQIRMVGDFSRALEDHELRLHFQPKLDLRTREISGAEALVRWQHPELGLLMPDSFVGPIEQAGRIAHLTRWVLRAAVAQCGAWHKLGLDIGVAVNISVDDLSDEYLPYFLLELVKKHGVAPQQLTLEVTESAIMHNVHKSLAVVDCIHEIGFRLAVDDFGTGHSALAQLKRLPVDELKVDKTFVMGASSPKDHAILRSTIDLAHQLGLSVVAEGVENDTALQLVTALGCEYAQGFGIGRPMPNADFLSLHARARGASRTNIIPFTVPSTAG